MKEDDITPPPVLADGEGGAVGLVDGARGATETKKCSNTKKGRCKWHGEGARSVYVPRMVTTLGAGGVRTTKLVKKWTWRCDLNLRAKTTQIAGRR